MQRGNKEDAHTECATHRKRAVQDMLLTKKAPAKGALGGVKASGNKKAAADTLLKSR